MARTLIVGGTGHLGQELVKACHQQGHAVHALVRPATRGDPAKMKPLEAAGATVHEGDLGDYDSLLRACRAVDSVISAVGSLQIGDEGPLVRAVKDAGVARFVPSDFGLDPVRAVNDPRMQNKEIRITANTLTQNELVALGQTTTGRTVKRTSVPARELEGIIASATAPDQGMALVAAQLHRSLWIRGDSVKRVPTSVEATEVYPDIKFQTIEGGLRQLV